jgi:hypothetical protein
VLKVAAAALYSVRGTMPHFASEPAHEQKSQASSSSKRSSSSDSASQEPQKRKKQKLKLMQDSGQTKVRAAHWCQCYELHTKRDRFTISSCCCIRRTAHKCDVMFALLSAL